MMTRMRCLRSKPLAAKSFALTVTWEMVRLMFPVLEMVTFWELELPTFIELKVRLVGFADMVTVPATPVPLNATVLGELGALLEILTVPVNDPAVVGANSTLNVVLCPAPIDVGVLRPLMLKAAPLTVTCASVSVAVPVLLTVKVSDLV